MVKYRDLDGEKKEGSVVDADAMFEAMGQQVRRSMVRRLREGGAMSMSKLGEPYKMSLPATFRHVQTLEESGIISTEKNGRVRICVYNPRAFKELASVLASQAAFWEANFDRLERHISKNKKK